jgi:hypothetical protein
MVAVLLAVLSTAAAYTPAQLAEYQGQIKASCEITLKVPGTDVPKGFCACFAKTSAPDAMALKPDERAVFLVLTENAGDPVGAQRMALSRLKMQVEPFAAAWEKLHPIGQKAGTACIKGKPAR